MKRAILATLLVATGARADTVWDQALHPEPDRDVYEAEMTDGDEFASQAASHSGSYAAIKHSVDMALISYKNAAKAMPAAAEPYFRIGAVIHGFYACEISELPQPPTCHQGEAYELKYSKDLVEAWDAFEARAPLDPRIAEFLDVRAIARTKLVKLEPQSAQRHLNGALRDYEAAIERWKDGLYARNFEIRKEQLYGNLAETYMMVGRLDDAIDAYKESLLAGGDTSVKYGLAVALDRDERTQQAIDLIRGNKSSNPINDFELYKERVQRGYVFYVPDGEQYYYLALIEEALGRYSDAMEDWRNFIQSGAHPQYQPRAKAHLEALKTQKRLRPPLPALDPFEGLR